MPDSHDHDAHRDDLAALITDRAIDWLVTLGMWRPLDEIDTLELTCQLYSLVRSILSLIRLD